MGKKIKIFFLVWALAGCSSIEFSKKDIIKVVRTPKFQYSLDELSDKVEILSRGKWWENKKINSKRYKNYRQEFSFSKISRDEIIAFALYTVHQRVLKLSVQFYPLLEDEEREVYLDFFFRWLLARSGERGDS